MKQFSWFCGKKSLCDYNTFLSKLQPNDLNAEAMKSQVSTLMTKINGSSKVCHGELYRDDKGNKGVILCFNGQEDLNSFLKLFANLNEKDLQDASSVQFDLKSTQTFKLWITDGHEALDQREYTFKEDGAYIGDNIVYRFDQIEAIDGKKCKISKKVPVIPLKFLEAKVYNPECVMRIKYDQIDTYIGSNDPNCKNIITYTRVKTKKNCVQIKEGPSKMFVNDLKSFPDQGKWAGWAYYYKVGSGEIPTGFHKVVIDKKRVTSTPQSGGQTVEISYKNIIWACDNDGACSFPEYIEYLKWTGQDKKLLDFQAIAPELKPTWALPDTNSCFVLEETFSHIICPTDNGEEYNMKLALSLAIDFTLVDAKAQDLKDYDLGGKYKVLYTTDSKSGFKDLTVVTKKEGVRSEKDNKMIVDFNRILPIKAVKCAFEFRMINLPVSMHEISPLCCTRFMTDENNYLCITPSSKCYIEIRKLVKLFRGKCLALQEKSPNGGGDPKPVNPDPKPEIVAKSGVWSGPVVFNIIDNYKYKGELAMFKGTLDVNQNTITFTVDGKKKLFYNTPSLEFGCSTGEPCLAADFYQSQEPYLEARYDLDWMKNTYDKFFAANKGIDKNDCMVLSTQEPEFGTCESILVCVLVTGQGPNLRSALKYAHYNKISEMDHRADKKEFKFVPAAYESMTFNALIMSFARDADIKSLAAVSTMLQITQFGIIYQKSKEYLIKWDEILDKKTLNEMMNMNPAERTIPPAFIKLGVDTKCCFDLEAGGKKHFICMFDKTKCMMDKAYLFKRTWKGVMHSRNLIIWDKKKKLREDRVNVDDPFEFGIRPKFKEFPENYNLLSLSVDQFDNSKNGKWYGWIFHKSLTERNYRLVTKPVFMKIEKGKIYLQTDVNEKPFKKIQLFQYKPACKKPCLPSEYLKAYSIVNSFDDQMYLQKSINSVLSELVKPYGENACTVLDFENPTYLYGFSEMLCAIDDAQGPKIREAIENAYYNALLNLDIDTQVKKISWDNDKFFGRLIIDDQIQNFNYFYLNSTGLVGLKVSESKTAKNRFPEGKDKFTLSYQQISNDNYGTLCAFWFKGLKVREKSEPIKTAVSDNNCCIRFFVLPDRKKYELCTFLINEGICIRESREIMKGLKEGCIFHNKYALPPDDSQGGKKKPIKMSDTYSENTLDDHTNGIFNGFVYFSNLLNAAQSPPVNPYFIKINKENVLIFKTFKSKKPLFSINVDEIQFNCAGYKPCSAGDFKTFAESKQSYLKFLTSFTTQYNTYQDNYPSIKPVFNTMCFVIETISAPFMVCPYDMKVSVSMQKALVQAYILNHNCKKLASVKDAEKETEYTIVHSQNGSQEEYKIIVNTLGVVNTSTKKVVLDYKKLDNDPVSNKKCAVWYKGVEVPFKFNHPECCFLYSTDKKEKYMCVKDERVCIGRAYQLMKQIWSGCMFNSPITESGNNPANAEVYGEPAYIEKLPFDPNRFKYDICPALRDSKIFVNEKTLEKTYHIDRYNDIVYSLDKTLYKGWFDLYPVNLKKESKFTMLHVYGELTPESFKFYKNLGDKEVFFAMRPDMLSSSCYSTCTPLEYGKYLKKINKDYEVLAGILDSREKLYEIKNDQGCAIIENEINGEENNYMICINVRKPKTDDHTLAKQINGFNYSAKRTAISSHYGLLIRKVIYDSSVIARKFINKDSLPVSHNKVSRIRITDDQKVLEYFNATISDDGIMSANGLAVKFDDIDSCDVYFNPVFVKENAMIDQKRSCCFRYQFRAVFEYGCIETLDCEYNTLALAREFYEKCLVKKGRKRSEDVLYNEQNTGKHFKALDYIRILFQLEKLNILNIETINNGPSALSKLTFNQRFR